MKFYTSNVLTEGFWRTELEINFATILWHLSNQEFLFQLFLFFILQLISIVLNKFSGKIKWIIVSILDAYGLRILVSMFVWWNALEESNWLSLIKWALAICLNLLCSIVRQWGLDHLRQELIFRANSLESLCHSALFHFNGQMVVCLVYTSLHLGRFPKWFTCWKCMLFGCRSLWRIIGSCIGFRDQSLLVGASDKWLNLRVCFIEILLSFPSTNAILEWSYIIELRNDGIVQLVNALVSFLAESLLMISEEKISKFLSLEEAFPVILVLWHGQNFSSITSLVRFWASELIFHFNFAFRKLTQLIITILVKFRLSILHIWRLELIFSGLLRCILFAQIVVCFLNELVGLLNFIIKHGWVSSVPS